MVPEYEGLNLTRLQSVLGEARLPLEEVRRSGPVKDPDREEALNLTFKKGIKVKDKVTGKGGEILGGTRTIAFLPSSRSGRQGSVSGQA